MLYEAASERQNRLAKVIGAAFGAEFPDEDPYPFLNSDSEQEKEKKHAKPWMIDPKQGGEVTPTYGQDEIAMLPINLGYSIIEKQD